MVSSRLSLCTRTPVGSTPRMATSAMAMTPRLIAISTIVNAATALFFSTLLIRDSFKLWPRRLIHTRAAGQPIDADEMVREIVRWLYRHVRRRQVTAWTREKDAAFRQGNQFVPPPEQLSLGVEADIRQRPARAFAGGEWKRVCIKVVPVFVRIPNQRRNGNRQGRINEIELVCRNQNALGQSLPIGNVTWIFLAGLIAHCPFGQQGVGGVLPGDEVGQLTGPTVAFLRSDPELVEILEMPNDSGRNKHHVNRGASADGPQPGEGQIVQQLALRARQARAFAKTLERWQADRREHADDRHDDEQLDQS